ncbi:MAG: terminase large subunit [Desulfamplus sp.]|nr:terminase large subunit [Desulfamplus sp.]
MRRHSSLPGKLPEWATFKLGSPPAQYDPFQQGEGFYLDVDAGSRAISFIETLCTHCRGPLKGQSFILEPFLKSIVGHLYGWRHEDTGLRRYRELLLLVPRKNAKTLLSAALGLLELVMGDPNSPEIIVASGTRDQARNLHESCKMMIANEPEFQKRLKVFKNDIKNPSNDGILRVVSSEAFALHGQNVSCAIVDETHVCDREMVETLGTSQGARLEPLMMNLSTAGSDRHTILWEKREYAVKVRDNVIDDPAFLPVLYEAPQDADWTDPAVWALANPNLGRSIFPDFLKRECSRAMESPAFESTFRRLYLNQWTESDNPWLSMGRFDECLTDAMPDLTGRPCYGGLDLSSTQDLSAFVCVFPPQSEGEPFYVMPWAWVPGDTILERSNRDKVPYQAWESQGYIERTPGRVIDYAYILNRIQRCAADYDLRGVCFDRWGSAKLVQQLDEAGITMIEFGQGFKSMSPPTKELMKLILEQKITFPDNPVLRWCCSNMVLDEDPAGNLKPNKGKSIEKIDVMVALIMALDAGIRNTNQNVGSVYDKRGFLTL